MRCLMCGELSNRNVCLDCIDELEDTPKAKHKNRKQIRKEKREHNKMLDEFYLAPVRERVYD